jgi:ferritin
MLSEKMQAALNDQLNMELGAYYVYLSMAAHLETKGMSGFSSWMYTHAEEEMTHAMKFYSFIHRRRGKVILQQVDAPTIEWSTLLDVFEDALGHEEAVTASIGKMVTMARAEGDHATDSFLQWFVDEQVEEEELVDGVIQKLKLIGDSGSALYMLDQEMAAETAAEGGAEEEA